MVGKKRDFAAEKVAFHRLAVMKRFHEGYPHQEEFKQLWLQTMRERGFADIDESVFQMDRSGDIQVMEDIAKDICNRKDPISPLPAGTKPEDYAKSLQVEAMRALFDLYHLQETKHEIACKYRRGNGSSLNRWLAYHLSEYFCVKRNASTGGDFFASCFPEHEIPLDNRTDAHMVEIMLTLLEMGRLKSFGGVYLYEGNELPPRGRPKRHKR